MVPGQDEAGPRTAPRTRGRNAGKATRNGPGAGFMPASLRDGYD